MKLDPNPQIAHELREPFGVRHVGASPKAWALAAVESLGMVSLPGTYREAYRQAVSMTDAKAAWIPLAREALLRVARVYHGLINYGELADELQTRSGIKTRQLMHYWIGDALLSLPLL